MLEVFFRGEEAQEEIVVWVDPKDWPKDAPRLWPTIDLAQPDPALIVVGRWFANIENSGQTPKPLIVKFPDGTIEDFGLYKPGSGSALGFGLPSSCAYYELLSERQDQVIARLLVVPSVYARLIRANERVTFQNLLPGSCKVNCWFAHHNSEESTVQLVASKVTQLTLTAPRPGASRKAADQTARDRL